MDLSAVTLGTSSTFRFPKMASISHRSVSAPCSSKRLTDRASSASNQNPLISTLKSAGVALVFSAVMFGKFPPTPIARAEESPAAVEELQQEDQELEAKEDKSPLTQFLESSPEAIEALKTLLQKKVEDGEDEEILKLLNKLSAAQPENPEWKLLTAKQYNQMGKVGESRAIFEEILSENPLSFEALFENALLMNGCGEGERVIERLKEALKVAEEENKAKEARDVRLIIAQMLFLQKNVEEAMRSYDELVREDPKDFRPYFCKGMIYSLLDRDKEAREQFAKSRELSPKKFEVEGHFRTLSLLKKSGTGTDEGNK